MGGTVVIIKEIRDTSVTLWLPRTKALTPGRVESGEGTC